MPELIDLDDLDSIVQEFTEQHAKRIDNPNAVHYVDNATLYEAYKVYHSKVVHAEENNLPRPQPCNTICQAIIDISTNVARKQNFSGYIFKEEMIADAIENCIRYVHNFDPIKYDNPFAYITRTVIQAFKRRIKMEKKQYYLKLKSFDNAGGFSSYTSDNVNKSELQSFDETMDLYKDYLHNIDEYERKHEEQKEKTREKLKLKTSSNIKVKKINTLTEFLE